VFYVLVMRSDKDKSSGNLLSLLTKINSQVSIKNYGAPEFENLVNENIKISTGSTVKTSETGRAVLESDSKTITVVDRNSEIVVDTQENNKTKIELESGNLWSRIKKVLGKGEYYEVQTTNAVATVRGTSFGVYYENGKTTIVVVEGQVALKIINPETGEQIGSEKIIEAGQKATVVTGQDFWIGPISDNDKETEWYKFNNPVVESTEPTVTVSPSSLITLAPRPTYTPTPTSLNQGGGGPSQGGGAFVSGSTRKLNFIEPEVIYGYSETNFTIVGENLSDAAQVFLGEFLIQSNVVNSQTIAASLTQEIPPGVYDVVVVFPDQEFLSLPKSLTLRY